MNSQVVKSALGKTRPLPIALASLKLDDASINAFSPLIALIAF